MSGPDADVAAEPQPQPSASARLVVAVVAARVAFGLAYLAGTLRRAPIPWYQPIERTWSFGGQPGGLAMEWYGRTAVAMAAALVAGAVAWGAGARGPLGRALTRPALVLALARACGLVLLVDFAYFGWVLMHPAPLTAGAPPGEPGSAPAPPSFPPCPP